MHFTSAELPHYSQLRDELSSTHLELREHLRRSLDPVHLVDNRPALDSLITLFRSLTHARLNARSPVDEMFHDLTLLAFSHHLHNILNFVLPSDAVPSLPPIDTPSASFDVTHPTPTTAVLKPTSPLAPYTHATLHLSPVPVLQLHLPGSPPLLFPATPVFLQHLIPLLLAIPASRPS